ncbi:response regulator [Cellulophaga sp. E16_2]|uniref:Response regulator receiver n=1 Tax=Cellulophaga algicola (strain DSM 14237 / IC166 / ACAM 630) TaxID=688270 RepID=E6X6J2_CELAD|nr:MULTISPECIES: response regulator [Cellulophaga]ADV48498.1 response regulator receiver [Cellulophaga algicola DSM 14237]MBO0590916.1 response regulator [Cellulophaga sp. E16_2]
MISFLKKIYFVDDDPIFTFISKKLMKEEQFGASLIGFEHGKEAIEALLECDEKDNLLPTVIFLDISMPVMNGWEFLDSFQAAPINNKEKIKIVVMSSSINPLEIGMIKNYPIVHDYIVKPITPADLNKIKDCLINEHQA